MPMKPSQKSYLKSVVNRKRPTSGADTSSAMKKKKDFKQKRRVMENAIQKTKYGKPPAAAPPKKPRRV